MASEEYQSMAKFVYTWDATERERQSLELKRQTEADLNRAGEKVERCHQRYRQLVADLRWQEVQNGQEEIRLQQEGKWIEQQSDRAAMYGHAAETGIRMEIDRLGFVNENYFYGDDEMNLGKLIYEISFFFYMKVPDDFKPVSSSFTEDDHKEFLRWVSPDDEITVYPEFFKTELQHPENTVKHILSDERKKV